MNLNFYINPINCKSLISQTCLTFKSDKKTDNILEKSPYKDFFELSIGYVNDTHGQTNNMMRILSGLKGDIRLSAGDNDIGDEKNSKIHNATAKFLNLAKIEASALGNHEMDSSQSDLVNSMDKFNGDYLVVNMEKERLENQKSEDVKKFGRADVADYIKRSKIVEVNGEKVGIVGASPEDMFDRVTHPNYHTDCNIKKLDDTIAEIQNEVDFLRKQGINKIILVSHLGHKRDVQVAQKTEGIDVIIGGHTHELLSGVVEEENLIYSKNGEPVILTEAGKDGRYFGQLNLIFDKDGVVEKVQNNIGETGLFHKNMIHQYIFDQELGIPEKVGVVESAPNPPKTLIEENPHANFVCDVMKEEMGADIGLWNNGGIRNYFHEGEIDSRDIKDIAPFYDKMALAEITEKTLVDMFKSTVETTYKSQGFKPGLLAVSGLKYAVNEKEGKLSGMSFIDKDGNEIPIDIDNPREDKTYKVATDEYMMSAGADYAVLAPADKCLEILPYDKDVLTCNYIKKMGKPVVINQTGRIRFE